MSHDSLVPVAEFLYRGDAEVAKAMLGAAGIEAYVASDDEGGLSPGFFSDHRVRLLVSAGDADAARELLDGT